MTVQEIPMAKYTSFQQDDFVRINVCGMIYETLKCTLERYPSTLLGDPMRRERYFVKSKNAYFFDRHRQCFEAILYYYQSGGLLIRPPNVDMLLFAEEFNFYGLEGKEFDYLISEKENDVRDEEAYFMQKTWRSKIWALFEYPDTSLWARSVTTWSIFVISLSIIAFILETMPMFQQTQNDEGTSYNNISSTSLPNLSSRRYRQPWFSIELFCIVWFTFEYIMRFVSSPNKVSFLKSFLNLVDLIAILPYYISMLITDGGFTSLSVLRIVRLVRVFRIFKLSRHSVGLQALGQTLKASGNELLTLAFFLMLAVVLFSSAIYYAEWEVNPHEFKSIPDSFWFTLTTIKTLGYGDKIPKTSLGKVVGSVCAVIGVLTIALPVPIIVSKFTLIYKKEEEIIDFRKRKFSTKDATTSALVAKLHPTNKEATKINKVSTFDAHREIAIKARQLVMTF